METETIRVQIPKDILPQLERRARRAGRPREQFAGDILTKALRAPTLREIFSPVRKQIIQIGTSENELDDLFEQARERSYRARIGENGD